MDSTLLDLLVRFFVLTISLSVHEFAHAWSAYRFGDDTAARMGRMTLNPVPHLDPVGSLMILAGMPLGWAKPVPVDVGRLRNPLRHDSWVAFAGPLSNVLLGLACVAGFWALGFGDVPTGWYLLLLYFIHINFALAVFNLLPLPPLDGARVVPLVLSRPSAERWEAFITRLGIWPLVALLALELLPGRGPLGWWFALWNPVFRPVLDLAGVPGMW